jgi:hypothetical protein
LFSPDQWHEFAKVIGNWRPDPMVLNPAAEIAAKFSNVLRRKIQGVDSDRAWALVWVLDWRPEGDDETGRSWWKLPMMGSSLFSLTATSTDNAVNSGA